MPDVMESVQRARAVRRLSAVESQVRRKTAEGYTVYIATATHKVKHGRDTLEFEPLMEMDESDLRPQLVGGIFFTKDPDVIARIEGLNPRIYTERFEPKQEAQEVRASLASFEASVERRGDEADAVALEDDSPTPAPVADKAALLANAGKKGK